RAKHDADSPGQRLVLAGESAGGNLALALLLTLRDAGERLPDAAALFSPATDLSGGSASIEGNAERDAMFHGPSLEHLGHAYLGPAADPPTPRASPIHGDPAGLPPLLFHVASDEALRDDGTRFAEKARAAGVHVEATVWPIVPHAWQLLKDLPEARRSIARAS